MDEDIDDISMNIDSTEVGRYGLYLVSIAAYKVLYPAWIETCHLSQIEEDEHEKCLTPLKSEA